MDGSSNTKTESVCVLPISLASLSRCASPPDRLGVFQALLDNGATVIVIEHDLDVIRNADYVIDMGPGGGDAGGRIVASGTPQEIRENQASITGRYL